MSKSELMMHVTCNLIRLTLSLAACMISTLLAVPSINCVPVESIEHATVPVHQILHDCNAVQNPNFRPVGPPKPGL